MKRRKKKKGKIFAIILILLLIAAGIIFYPKLSEKSEITKLNKEISMTNNYLSKGNNANELNKYIDKSITTGKRKKVEVAIEKYLKDIITNNHDLLNIIKDKKTTDFLSINNIETKEIKDLKEEKEAITKVKDNIQKISKDTYLDSKDKYVIDLYNKLVSNIDVYNYLKNIDNNLTDIDNIENALAFLDKNKTNWKVEDNTLVFLKRTTYNEFTEEVKKIKLKINLPKYKLINDTKGPEIKASDLTTYKGDAINLKEKIKCIDDIDGEVECNISGEYDVNKVGSYQINISAIDESKNTSEKTITLTVREKALNPYYTEVIRNQNTVIVYGLDSNNKYTNIVKVFPCSVGKNNATPVGTFQTSPGYAWGALVGGVYGQYSTRIVGSILFHSVPYYKMAKDQLEWEEFNKLGEPASLGCVRMTVRDVKWIFDNCPAGMTVKIYDGNLPEGITKPTAPKIDGTSPNRGWDPTDPDPNNPWNKED